MPIVHGWFKSTGETMSWLRNNVHRDDSPYRIRGPRPYQNLNVAYQVAKALQRLNIECDPEACVARLREIEYFDELACGSLIGRIADRVRDGEFPSYRVCQDCGGIFHEDDVHFVGPHDRLICGTCIQGWQYYFVHQLDTFWERNCCIPYYATERQFNDDAPECLFPDGDSEAPSFFRLLYDGDNDSSYWVHEDIYNYCVDVLNENRLYDDSSDSSDRDPFNGIAEYHSCKQVLGHVPSLYDSARRPLFLGLELEVEVKDGYASEHASRIRSGLNATYRQYCGTEHDGSLNNGFEIVTGYTGLDTHEKYLAPFKDTAFGAGLASHNTKTCGLHVHIDRANMNTAHALRLAKFMHDPDNRNLVMAVARRYGTGYCEVNDKKSARSHVARLWRSHWNSMRNPSVNDKMASFRNARNWSPYFAGSRYEAVNFGNSRTIEFRIFKGSLKFETIMACLEFTRAAWLFTEESSDLKLNTDCFLAFIQQPRNKHETRYLRHLLKAKGFDVKAYPRELQTSLATRMTRRKQRQCAYS